MIDSISEAFEQMKKCNFTDEHGHKMELNVGYMYLKEKFINETNYTTTGRFSKARFNKKAYEAFYNYCKVNKEFKDILRYLFKISENIYGLYLNDVVENRVIFYMNKKVNVINLLQNFILANYGHTEYPYGKNFTDNWIITFNNNQ